MNKEEFPKELTIIEFFTNGGKGTKKEIAEGLGIPPNESPTKRWRDKLDSILRRLNQQGMIKRERVQKGSIQLYEYCLNDEMATNVRSVEPAHEAEVNKNGVEC